jgi:hypothetical protein
MGLARLRGELARAAGEFVALALVVPVAEALGGGPADERPCLVRAPVAAQHRGLVGDREQPWQFGGGRGVDAHVGELE